MEPDKPINGQRRCPQAVIGRARVIKRARILGFTLLEIGNLLELDEPHACTETRELATPHVLAARNRKSLRFARTAGAAIGRRRCSGSPGTAGDGQFGRHGSRGNERLALTGSSARPCARTCAGALDRVERGPRAVQARTAAGGHPKFSLQFLEAATPGSGMPDDLGIGDSMAEADDHGSVPAMRRSGRLAVL